MIKLPEARPRRAVYYRYVERPSAARRLHRTPAGRLKTQTCQRSASGCYTCHDNMLIVTYTGGCRATYVFRQTAPPPRCRTDYRRGKRVCCAKTPLPPSFSRESARGVPRTATGRVSITTIRVGGRSSFAAVAARFVWAV